MQCPECQFDNADDMNFCGKCGYSLSTSSKTASKDLSLDEKLKKIQKYLPKGLTERVLSQRDKIEGEEVMFYQVDLELIDIQSHKKVWIGDKKIKKYITQSRLSL